MAHVRTILRRLAALITPLLAISSGPAQAATTHIIDRNALDDSARQNAEFRRALSETPRVLTSDSILQSAGLAAGVEIFSGLGQKKPSADARRHTRSHKHRHHRQQREHRQQRHRRKKH